MTDTLIVYKSMCGYSKRYVDIIGSALKCDAVPLEKFKLSLSLEYNRIVYVSSLRSGKLLGLDKFKKFLPYVYLKLVVVAVGITPDREGKAEDLKLINIPETMMHFVPMFYLRGGFDFKRLPKLVGLTYSLMVRSLAEKPDPLTADEEAAVTAMEQSVDFVSPANADIVIRFLKGEQVDETKFSPAELDPEDLPTYLETLNTPVTEEDLSVKEKELKKKLKKKLK